MKIILHPRRKLILLFSIMLTMPDMHAEPKWQVVTEGLSYDKNSIIYPREKKLLGMTVKDKDIVRVWVRSAFGERQFEFYCRKRLVDLPGLRMDINGNLQTCQESYASKNLAIPMTPQEINIFCSGYQTENVRPGSGMEKLMEKVCR